MSFGAGLIRHACDNGTQVAFGVSLGVHTAVYRSGSRRTLLSNKHKLHTHEPITIQPKLVLSRKTSTSKEKRVERGGGGEDTAEFQDKRAVNTHAAETAKTSIREELLHSAMPTAHTRENPHTMATRLFVSWTALRLRIAAHGSKRIKMALRVRLRIVYVVMLYW